MLHRVTLVITETEVLCTVYDIRARHCKKFLQLHKTQHPPGPPDNLSEVPLEEAACSALNKGLNYSVAPGHIPEKDFLCGVEKAIGQGPEGNTEEI
jgi:hypothetical protein